MPATNSLSCNAHTGVTDHQYSLADLEKWCASEIEASSAVSIACPLLKRFLTSAQDTSLITEARSGLMATVALVKQASEGESKCRSREYSPWPCATYHMTLVIM